MTTSFYVSISAGLTRIGDIPKNSDEVDTPSCPKKTFLIFGQKGEGEQAGEGWDDRYHHQIDWKGNVSVSQTLRGIIFEADLHLRPGFLIVMLPAIMNQTMDSSC